MKVEYLNALVQTATSTFQTMLSLEAKVGQLSLKKEGIETKADITAVLGMSGKVRGSIVLAFESKVASQYVKRFLGMDDDLSMDEICDGVGELCNIIGGSAKVELNKFGLDLSISIPNVVIGQGMKIASSTSYPSLCIPFDSELGSFTLEVCLTK